ncbi:MAG TPA: hypothetical protein VGK56_15065, partial [Anaerolineales bacterium]
MAGEVKGGTPQEVPTFGLDWLPGQDSNLRPAGYKAPNLSTGLGLSHHPPEKQGRVSGAIEAVLDGVPQPLVSARSCLHAIPSAGFAQDYRSAQAGTASLNSPDGSTT